MKNIDYILSARHISKDGTAKGYYKEQADAVLRGRGVSLDVSSLDKPVGSPVSAKVYRGQWIAECECGGASFVDIELPAFMCFSCGNRVNNGNARPVTFPKDKDAIEKALLERPVDDIAGLTDAERAGAAKPMIFVEGQGGLSRDWLPDETLEDLKAQQDKPIAAWKKRRK